MKAFDIRKDVQERVEVDNNRKKQRQYAIRRKARGFVKVSTWVHVDDRDMFRQMTARLPNEHRFDTAHEIPVMPDTTKGL